MPPAAAHQTKPRLDTVLIGHELDGVTTLFGHLLVQVGRLGHADHNNHDDDDDCAHDDHHRFANLIFPKEKMPETNREATGPPPYKNFIFESEHRKHNMMDTHCQRDAARYYHATKVADAMLLCLSAANISAFAVSENSSGPASMACAPEMMGVMCARMWGIRRIVVAVTKMDNVRFEESQFNFMRNRITQMLVLMGFPVVENKFMDLPGTTPTDEHGQALLLAAAANKKQRTAAENNVVRFELIFVPVSGLRGVNLAQPCSSSSNSEAVMPWYKGPTLLEALDMLSPIPSAVDLPLRISVKDVYKIQMPGRTHASIVPVADSVIAGRLRAGDPLTVAPSGVQCTAGIIESERVPVESAGAGELEAGFAFELIGAKLLDVKRGFVIGHSHDFPPAPVISFIAVFQIGRHPGQLLAGYTPVMDCSNAHIAVKFDDIIEFLDPHDPAYKRVLQPGGKTARARTGDMIRVKCVPARPMCVEPFSEFPALGKLTVRDMRYTVAVGFVESVQLPPAVIQQRKWMRRRIAMLIREKAKSRMGIDAFAVWAIMQRVALYLA